MNVDGIRSTTDLGLAAGTAAAAGREELGKNEFMELMIAQFNNQDPLEPAKNEDFIAQLAHHHPGGEASTGGRRSFGPACPHSSRRGYAVMSF